MLKSYLLKSLVVVSLLAGPGGVHAGAYSRAVSRNGGYASAHSESYGNAEVRAESYADHGGTARSRARGWGGPGACTNVLSRSIAHGGIAESVAIGRAYDCSRVDVRGVAVTSGGRSSSNARGIGRGNSRVDSWSRAESEYGVAESESYGRGAGWHGGRADVRSDVVARSVGNGIARARGRVVGRGYGGDAWAHGVSRSMAGPGRSTWADTDVESLSDGGVSRAYGESFDY